MPKKVYINVDIARSDDRAIIKYIDSDRSDGKTTTMIKMAYDEYHETGKIAVCARRWVPEVTDLYINVLFANLKKVRPVGALKAAGSAKKSGVHLYEDGKEFAVVIPLSRVTAFKSSFDVATHRNLYIDEYVPLDRRYLFREAEIILDLYRTIDRDTWTNSVWVFSNHVTNNNPLFDYYDVIPRDGISRWKNDRFLLLRVANKGNRAAVMSSPLGELTQGTPYGSFAAGGSLVSYDQFIHAKHDRGRMPVIIRDDIPLGLFYSSVGLVIDKATPQPGDAVYTTAPNPGSGGGMYIKATQAKEVLNAFRRMFHSGRIYAASDQILTAAQKFWKILEQI